MVTEFLSQAKTSRLLSALSHKLIIALAFVIIVVGAVNEAYAVEYINQSGYAMAEFNAGAYDIIYNKNTTLNGYSFSTGSTYASTSGPKMSFESMIYTDIPNPQSICVNPEGTVAWVLSSYKSGSDNSRHGRVYRVDIAKYWGKDASGDNKNSKAVKAGPEIVTGHGQTIAYNPVKNELWYVRETKGKTTTFVQVDPDSLKIVKEIHTAFGRRGTVPPVMCFDREGNFWMYTRSAGTNYAPKGTIRFYKGKIENNRVSCVQVNQGLRYPPGPQCQAIGYNPYNDRLYVMANGEILTVPATKISKGKCTAKDVEVIIFNGAVRRECEGITFSEDGTAFFMTNKPCEIMRDSISYKTGVVERERIKEVKAQYKEDKAALDAEKNAQMDAMIIDQIGERLELGF